MSRKNSTFNSNKMSDMKKHEITNYLTEEMNNLIETYCPRCGRKNDPNNFCSTCNKCKDLNMFRCLYKKCDKSYKYILSARIHIKKKHLKLGLENFHACPSCSKKCSNQNNLNEHLKICFKKANLVCEHCDFKTDWPRNLRRHKLRCHRKVSKNIRSCRKCNKVFLDAKGLNAHKNRFCKSKTEFNKRQKKMEPILTNVGNVKNHQLCLIKVSGLYFNNIIGLKKFKMYCLNCNEKSNDLLSGKIKNCKECKFPMAIYCKKCKLRFRKINSIVEHSRKNCKPKKILYCNDCEYTSHKKSGIREHIEAIHLCEKRCCIKCGKSYKLLRQLQKHQKCCKKSIRSEHQSVTKDPENLGSPCEIEVEQTEVSGEIFSSPHENAQSSESEIDAKGIDGKTPNLVKLDKKNIAFDTHITGGTSFTETSGVNTDENERINPFVEIYCPVCDSKYSPNDCKLVCIKCKKPNEFHCLYPNCYLHFTQLHGLKVHIHSKHLSVKKSGEMHKCLTCSKSFRYLKNWEKHKGICLKKTIHHCDNEVTRPDHLDQNMVTHNENPINETKEDETHTSKNIILSDQNLKENEKQPTESIHIVICSDCNHKVCKRIRHCARIKTK